MTTGAEAGRHGGALMSGSGKIVIAMSGGVDSSVAASLLKDAGREVVGIGFKFPAPGAPAAGSRRCCGVAGMKDARAAASALEIPFYVLDYREVFERTVIESFCRSYLEGKTPNPCIECNRLIKFGRLLEFADGLGAESVATGHYARVERAPGSGRHLLKTAGDLEQDQSYFLYTLSQAQLARAAFPLGGIRKEGTREIARSLGLTVSEKPSSQDICFLGDGDYREFLTERFPEALAPGPIVDRRGKVLGTHAGIANYTAGQRRGLGVAGGVPLYVIETDRASSTVVVGTREEAVRESMTLAQLNWIAFDEPADSFRSTVRIRHRHPPAPCVVSRKGDGRVEVLFSEPQAGVAPGQSAVFYDGDVVVGGGIIE